MGLNAALRTPDDAPQPPWGDRAAIVYGAGSAGRHLLKILREQGFGVDRFIDARAERIGAIDTVPVQSPEALEAIDHPGQYVLIIAINAEHTFETIRDRLARRFPAFGAPLRSRDVVQSLAEARCTGLLDDGAALDLRDCMGCRADIGACPAFRRGAERAAPVPLRHAAPRARINDIAYFITNRCTLNCTHCVEALPQHEHHYNDSAEQVVGTIRKLVATCGFIHRLSLTGGEILLHRELPALLDALLAEPGVGYIFPYTSGTVAPRPELLERLAHPRICVNVSDYGEHTPPRLRENFDAFVAALAERDIAYAVLPNKVWMDMGQFEDLHLDEAAMRASFAKCVFTNCMTISRGVLYRCPHQLAGANVGRLEIAAPQAVTFDTLEGDALVDALNRFADLDYIDACGRCKLSDDPQEVPAALQSPRRRTIPLALARADTHTPGGEA